MLVLMFDNWKARPRRLEKQKELLELKVYQARKEAYEVGDRLLAESRDCSAQGLIVHAEKKFSSSK